MPAPKHRDASGHRCADAGEATGLYKFCGETPESLPLTFTYNPAQSKISSANFLQAIRGAADAWNKPYGSAIPSPFGTVLQIANASTTRGLAKDGVNVVLWGDPADCHLPGAIAVACLHYAGPSGSAAHRIVEVDIILNVDETWRHATDLDELTGYGTGTAAVALASWFDVQAVLTHEFGHAIGLEHFIGVRAYPSDLTDAGRHLQTMYAADYRGSTAKRSLEAGDILGLREVVDAAN